MELIDSPEGQMVAQPTKCPMFTSTPCGAGMVKLTMHLEKGGKLNLHSSSTPHPQHSLPQALGTASDSGNVRAAVPPATCSHGSHKGLYQHKAG